MREARKGEEKESRFRGTLRARVLTRVRQYQRTRDSQDEEQERGSRDKEGERISQD